MIKTEETSKDKIFKNNKDKVMIKIKIIMEKIKIKISKEEEIKEIINKVDEK
jgi:hypothetical protein